MAGHKADILWSPNQDDKFLIFGSELALYKVDNKRDEASLKGMKISDEHWANLICVNSSPENQYMKCLAWYPHKEPDNMIAVGLANGKVLLQSFAKGGSADPQNLIGREFVPKHARPCNYLAWHPTMPNLLAQGLEKYRADCCTLVWDINTKYESSLSSDMRKYSASGLDTMAPKPYIELGHSETSLSFAWFPTAPFFVTGMNNKFLRIYDLRDITRPQSIAYTKNVYGIKVDPHFNHRLASFHEVRDYFSYFYKFFASFTVTHVLTLTESKQVTKISWSPTRSGLLACLTKDSPIIKLYDIQSTPVGSDELEPAVIEKIVQPIPLQAVASFDWHPSDENRMLSISPTAAVKDLRIFERIAIDWSADVHLTWGCGRLTKQINCVQLCEEAADDISIRMKRRALKGYGLYDEPWQNIKHVTDEPRLRNLWTTEENQLVATSTVVALGTTPPIPAATPLYGVKQILNGTSGDLRSEVDYWQWHGIEGYKFRARKTFKSEARSKALELCGWAYDKESASLQLIERLEKDASYERAAAIAIFSLKLRRAIQVLKSAAVLTQGWFNYSMVAMALSGFSDDKNTLWKEMCSSLSSQLTSPYLRAMFSFLTSDSETYLHILNETGLEISDKVALACMYLPDAKLTEYVDDLSRSLSASGNLDGILLTGLTTDSLDLFGQYVDITGDVQSVSLALVQGHCDPELAHDPRVSTWIDCYRGLLDNWRMWHQRAEFDVFRNSTNAPHHPPPPQVYVSCNFCGKSISSASQSNRSRHFMYGSGLAHKSKVSSCPGCRKPLPRCALCLINMGTSAGTGKPRPPDATDDDNHKLTSISEWFTWCQTCRHGGHASHMTQWFSEQSECPVTGCTCKCTLLDSMGPITNNELVEPLAQ
ncbi:hypothetical protein CAPTEDRAFT_157856 [Capitella teleta]|uniref:Uncharacterized protein n=1 Tax=Capitella teleta TaxID=283909 RepID=R7V9C9_CAPTE|nr:hypothetical protein CAPTEDRAFT_157856 [Capitella teleta]|eukprot:ELU15458.1 hypothetical protein CAPTEDRAFT_157856 [Capitella teleta]